MEAPAGSRCRAAGLLAATLFALHPAQAESVAWVTVPDPLMSLGILGALLLRKSRRSIRGNGTPGQSWGNVPSS
jgi:hypothetical protein